MKTILIVLIVSLAAVSAVAGETKSAHPQTSFGIEGTELSEKRIEVPVKLPNEVIQILRSDEDSERCLGGGTEGEIPTIWLRAFEGSEIDLNDDHLQDLIVMPTSDCIYGANVDPFWVFLWTPKGYKMVLNVYAHNLDVLKTRTSGFLDLESTSASAVRSFSNVFRFNGSQYVVRTAHRKR